MRYNDKWKKLEPWERYLFKQHKKDKEECLKKYGYYKDIEQDYNYRLLNNKAF